MPQYRLTRELMQDLKSSATAWTIFASHIQNWGGNISAVTIDGKRVSAGRIEITTSITLTPEQQEHLGVIPV